MKPPKRKFFLHEFLDKDFTMTDVVVIFLMILVFGSLVGNIFGRDVQACLGIILICVGIYGVVRWNILKKKQAKLKNNKG